MTKHTAIPAINVLLAYAALPDRDQQLFNSMLNEFVFASWVHKRELIEQWQQELVPVDAMRIVPVLD